MNKKDLLFELNDMVLDYVELLESLVMDEETEQRYIREKERFDKLHKELEKLENNG